MYGQSVWRWQEVRRVEILVFWMRGRLWEVVAYERWSHMEVRLYLENPTNGAGYPTEQSTKEYIPGN